MTGQKTRTEPKSPATGPQTGGDAPSVLPILHEIRHALDRLVATGEVTVIDLGAMPFGPADEEALDAVLGPGEVEATLDAGGESRVRESGIPAVWLVEHFGPGGDVQARFVEITFVPSILCAQKGDVEEGLLRLKDRLGDLDGTEP